MNPSTRGYFFIALAATLWGSLGIFFRILHDDFALPTLAIAFLRASVAAGLLFIFGLVARAERPRITVADLSFFILYGLCGVALFYFFFVQAVVQTSVTMAVVLLYTAPAFVALIANRLWKEPLHWRKVIAIGVSFAGCALIARAYDSSAWRVNAAGLLVGLGAGFTYALYTVFSKRALVRHTSSTALFFALAFGAVFLLPMQDWGTFSGLTQTGAWVYVTGLALVPTLGALALYNAGLARVPASNASLVAALEPVSAATLAYLILNERLELVQIIGGALVVGAAVGLGFVRSGQTGRLGGAPEIQERERADNDKAKLEPDETGQTTP